MPKATFRLPALANADNLSDCWDSAKRFLAMSGIPASAVWTTSIIMALGTHPTVRTTFVDTESITHSIMASDNPLAGACRSPQTSD